MTAPLQTTAQENPVASGDVVDFASPAAAGSTLVAAGWGRGGVTGTPVVYDNVDPSPGPGLSGDGWTEMTGSPYYNGSTGTLVVFTKVAVGGELHVTIDCATGGNKGAFVIFEVDGGVVADQANAGSSGAAGVMDWSTGDLGGSRALVLGFINVTADDASHDYVGTATTGGTTEVFDGTIGDAFAPGYWCGWAEDVDEIAGTWNHWPQGYVSLALGLSGPAVPVVPGPIFSVDGVQFESLLEQRVRFEFNAPGAGYMVLSKGDPQAVPAMVYRGAVVQCTFPEIHPDPLFEFYLEEGDFDVISGEEEGGEELRFGGPGTLSILRRCVVRSTEFRDGIGYPKPKRGVWVFDESNTEGHIMNKLINEGLAPTRPAHPLAGMTKTFTADEDSDGHRWDDQELEGRWRVKIGTNLYDAVMRLVNSGLLQIEMRPGLVLDAWRNRGVDRHSSSFALGKVRFVKGTNIADELTKALAGQHFATHAEVKFVDNDDDVHYIHATKDAGDFSYDKEVYLEVEASHANTARRQAKHAMKLREDLQDAIEFGHPVPWPGHTSGDPDSPLIAGKADEAHGWYLPGPEWSDHGSYWVGDLVTLYTGPAGSDFEWTNSTKRVYAITLYADPNGYLAPPIVELNAPHRKGGANRVLAGISGTLSDLGSGGGVGGGGGGGGGTAPPIVLGGGYQPLAEKGDADGYAGLDDDAHVPADQLAGGLDGAGYIPVAQGDGTVVWSPTDGTYDHVEVLAAATGAVELDYEVARWWDLTLAGDVTYTIVNPPPPGSAGRLHVIRRQGATPHTETWPAEVSWQDTDGTPGGPPPVLFTAVGAINHAELTTFDEGVSYGGSDITGGPAAGAGVVYVPVMALGTTLVTTDGEPVWLVVTTSGGDAVMAATTP